MKKTFLFLSLLLAMGLVFAANITPIRTDVSGFTDWTDTNVAGTTYLQLLVAGANTISPAMNFDNYTSETLDFKARTYGGVNTVENTVTVAVSTNNGSSWTDIGTRTPTTSTLTAMAQFDLSSYNGTQVKIRFIVAGTANGVGIGIDDITIAGTPSVASISVNPSTLSGFTYVYGSGPSQELSFALSGSNLTGNLSVSSAGTNFEIASTSGGTFGTSLSYTPSGGSVSATVYVQLKSGLAIGNYNSETITASSTGATSQNVTCSGSVTSPPPPDAPVATAATNVGNTSFTANWNSVSGATGYYLDVYTKTSGDNANDLFFSEYLEGTSNNKAIEIYNGTGAAVDLSGYTVYLYTGGASSHSSTLALSGTLANNDVYVIANSSAGSVILAIADITSGVANYNGDDALSLWNETTSSYADIFGCIGEDPGTIWGTDPYVTAEKTLVRKASIKSGVTSSQSGFPTLATEWDSYAQDTFTYLGSHTMAGGTTITYVSGYQNLNVNNVTTYNVTGLTPGTTYYYVVRAYNAYGTSDDSNEIEVTTTSTSPLITLSTATLTGFTYMEGSGPSTEQSFTVSGSNLTANISIDAPTNYEISTGTGANFNAGMADPLTLTQSGGSVGTTTIYVRLKAGLTAGNYNSEVITASSTGATNQTVTCSGTVTAIPDPAITVSVATLSGFSYIVGAGPSTSMYFTVSGTYLTDDIEVTAPTNYEISDDDATFTGSITLTAAKLDVAETTLYVRLKAGLAIGSYAENLTVSTAGATDETIALSGDVLTDDIPFLYWDFNDNIPATNTNWPQPIVANYGTGSLTYTFTQAYSFNGTTLNTMAGDISSGGSFVPRGGQNSVENNGAEFVMTVVTTDLENIVLTYATQRTSTGFTDQAIWYSLDGGQNYTLFTTITSIAESWEVKQIDFTSITGANDNPNFMVKIVLTGASSESGNNRFDNISFFGDEEDVNPVELASFTATISAQNYITLTWVTQTETGMRGYYIFRDSDNNFAGARIVSPMIASANSSQQQTYFYEDTDVSDTGTYFYWLQASDLDGTVALHGPVSVYYNALGDNPTPEIPLVTELKAVYPNPFNPLAFIPFSLAKDSNVDLRIYNTRGQIVKHFDLGSKTAGTYRVSWDGTDYNGQILSNGVYHIVMTAGKDVYQTKAVLLK